MAVIYRAMTKDGSARALVMDSTDIVERARDIHKTSPTATAALGRTLTACSLMSSMLGEKENMLTLRFQGNGSGGTIVASGDYYGNVRGYIEHPDADLNLRPDGKLDVGGLVGKGSLYVLRDTGAKEPYVGISKIQTGEIAEDIAFYFAESEQIPTVCALGVLVDRDRTVLRAGGALIQLLPFSDPNVSDRLESNAKNSKGITSLLLDMPKGDAKGLLDTYLDGIEYDIFDEVDCSYKCVCSREKTDRALVSLGEKELTDLINSDEETVMTCGFCDNVYKYSKSDLKKLLAEAKKHEKH